MLTDYRVKYRLHGRAYRRGEYDEIGCKATTEHAAREKVIEAFKVNALRVSELSIAPAPGTINNQS